MWEEDHLADRRHACDEHHEPVDADPEPTARREPVLERAYVVVVDSLRFFVAGRLQPRLRLEALALVDRVVELAERVGQLTAERDDLEPFDDLSVPTTAAVQAGSLWVANARFGIPTTEYWVTRLPLRP